MDASLNVLEWLELPDNDKQKYICRYYVAMTKDEYEEHDCGVFSKFSIKDVGLSCQICDTETEGRTHDVLFGTQDSREPKFCMLHWTQLHLGQKNISRFYIAPEPVPTEHVTYYYLKCFNSNDYWNIDAGWVAKGSASKFTHNDTIQASVYPVNGAWETVGN